MIDDGVPILHGPPSPEEIRLQQENEKLRAEKETEAAFRQRQIDLTESGVKLTKANVKITWVLAIFTAIGAGAAVYQGHVSKIAADAAKSAADTAAQSLGEVKNGQGAQDTHTLAQQAVTQALQTTALAEAARRSAEAQISAAHSTASAANTARESLTSVQGAFLAFLGNASYDKVFESGKIGALTFTFPWNNIGNTATRNLDTHVNWKAFPSSGMPQNFDFADYPGVDKRQAEVGRGMAGNATINVPIAYLDLSRRKQLRLYVWGWATYDDVFNGTRRHLSEFCDEFTDVAISTEDATASSAQYSWKLQLCKSHNCYDQECSDYSQRVKLR